MLKRVKKTGSIAKAKPRLSPAKKEAQPIMKLKPNDLLAMKAREGDETAKSRLINENQGLITATMGRYLGLGVEKEDLLQAGNLGMLRAIKTYEPYKGLFTTYAVYWIRQSMEKELDKMGRTIRLPANIIMELSKLAKAKRELTGSLGRLPTEDELSRRTKLPKARVMELSNLGNKLISLDEEMPGNGDPFSALIHGDKNIDLTSLERELDREALLSMISSFLTVEQKDVLFYRYRLDDSGQSTRSLKEVGKILGISPGRAKGVEINAIRRLHNLPNWRHYLK